MNHSPLDQTELDRLVDDECDDVTRRALLERVAATQCWEQLALSFLEAQVLRKAMRELCSASATQARIEAVAVAPEVIESQPTSNRAMAARRRLLVITITSAALLIVALSSIWQRPRSSSIDWAAHKNPIVPEQHAAESSNAQLTNADVSLPSSIRFVVNDGRSDMPRVIDVPIEADAPSIDVAHWQPQSVLSDETRQWLATSGHEVEEAASLVPVTLPNGRSVAFPVHQVRVNYRGPHWHQ